MAWKRFGEGANSRELRCAEDVGGRPGEVLGPDLCDQLLIDADGAPDLDLLGGPGTDDEPDPGHQGRELTRRITEQTGLAAMTRNEFAWKTIQYYMRYTGIPVNFGITIALAFIVGAVVAGQTFYIFTIENLKQFGALKAIGVTNIRITGMILLQALVVALIGFAIGMGLAAAFLESTKNIIHLRGFYLPWQVMVGVGGAVIVIILLASLLSIRRVIVLEPAIVFRG
jgi:putative ABC transport system permease protein